MLLAGGVIANPAAAAGSRGSAKSYTLSKQGKAVLRWNPCQVIHYRVNLRFAPPGALQDVKTAVATVSKASGITFAYDGTTTVIPMKTYGKNYTPGKAASPVVLAWASPGKGTGTSDLLTSQGDMPQADLAGVGYHQAYWWTDTKGRLHDWRIVTGAAVFNTAFNSLPAGFGSGEPTRGQLILHELGHVMGLMHVDDESQVMFPRMGQESTFGAGDLAGLKKQGKPSGCIR
ncbi:MAG: hypothetical protein QG622_1547 [Actinomycetota bacterium]|nr:hypothetical protein [Actinomycetota bacterium]